MKEYAEAMEQTAKDLEDIRGVYRPMAQSALDGLQFLVSVSTSLHAVELLQSRLSKAESLLALIAAVSSDPSIKSQIEGHFQAYGKDEET